MERMYFSKDLNYNIFFSLFFFKEQNLKNSVEEIWTLKITTGKSI